MKDEKPLHQVIAEKSGMLNKIIQAKFGGNPDATAASGQENTVGDNTMKVTRSQASNAPGEVRDGKLVDVKAMAAAAARQDVPATDLMALARANDPYNEDSAIPATIAGAVTAAVEGLPGQEVSQDKSNDGALGSVEKTQAEMLSNKQHPAIEKAVETQVESQVGTTDPYKSLHASAEVDQIVARAQAVLSGAEKIRKAATEVGEHPGAGKTEDGGQGKVSGDPAKNPQQSAKTLGDGGAEKGASLSGRTSRRDVVAAIKAEMARRAKVEGALIDPAGDGASQDPKEGAASMGDGGTEKAAAVTAEKKDRPVAPMPENKQRYKRDEDNRDEEAESYWKKNKADERRFEREPATNRPINKELQEKLPTLALMKRELITRVAALQDVIASDDVALRLHLKRRHYNKDEASDMDFAGAAGKTKGEISTEHAQRKNDTHPFSPMMSRLWAAYGPVKTAADTGYEGKLQKAEGRDELRKQVNEWKTALKGITSEDKGSEEKLNNLNSQIEKGEKELAKASGVRTGLPFAEAMANTLDRLAVIAAVLPDINEMAEDSHEEVKSSKDKPHGTGAADQTLDLLEALGETVEDMEQTIIKLLKEMGHPELAKKKEKGEKAEEKAEGGAEAEDKKGPPKPEVGEGLPGAKGPMDFGAEDEAVEMIASNTKLDAGTRRAQINELRKGSEWKAQLLKVASKADAAKADVLASYWEVLRNGETVLKLCAADAYPVKTAQKQAEAFAWFATRDYGKKLLASVKYEGLAKTARLLGVSPMVRQAAGSSGAFNEYQTSRPAAPDKALTSGPADNPGLEGKDLLAFYTKAYGSAEFARELVKQYEQRQAMAKELAALKKTVAAQEHRSDALQKDMEMRAKATRALALADVAIDKGLLNEDKKASFIDKLMVGDETSFSATAEIVQNMNKIAAPKPEDKKEEGKDGEKKEAGKTTARDLIRIAAASGGLKTATVLPASSVSTGGLQEQLGSLWRVPPTPKAEA